MYNVDEIQVANATCRSRGSVGPQALVPRFIRSYLNSNSHSYLSVLDYGAGISAIHARELQAEGYNVTAWEFGDNFNPNYHDSGALDNIYDIVYASNVLNVLCSKQMLNKVLAEIQEIGASGGYFIFNFPRSPRKGDFDLTYLKEEVSWYFNNLRKIPRYTGCYICEFPKGNARSRNRPL